MKKCADCGKDTFSTGTQRRCRDCWIVKKAKDKAEGIRQHKRPATIRVSSKIRDGGNEPDPTVVMRLEREAKEGKISRCDKCGTFFAKTSKACPICLPPRFHKYL